MIVVATTKFSRTMNTTATIITTSRVMGRLNPPVMVIIQFTNYILSIPTVIKVDKSVARWLSHNPNTSYNSICSKLILKLLLKNSSFQIANINTRHAQQQLLVETVDV